MKKNAIFVILMGLLLMTFFFSCKNEKGNAIKKKLKDGVTHIYNPSTPLKGKVKLELEKILEIDSNTLQKGKPVSFNQFVQSPSPHMRTYICDNSDFKIYIFDETGKLLNHFLGKGEGPGEFSNDYEYTIQTLGNDVWVAGYRKIDRFNLDGEFIEEIKFGKSYRYLEILDENRFFCNYYIMPTNQQVNANNPRKDVCVLMDRKEGVLKELDQEVGAGGTLVSTKLPNGSNINFDISLNITSKNLLHKMSTDRQKIYFNRSNGYIITIKNLNGETQLVIHRDYENISLNEQDRKEIIDRIFFRLPPEVKKTVQGNLPAKFIAILALEPLADDYLAVFPFTGMQSSSFKIDIFDREGQYIYELELPPDMERGVTFTKDVISYICSIDDHDVYRAYRIKNLPEIFKK